MFLCARLSLQAASRFTLFIIALVHHKLLLQSLRVRSTLSAGTSSSLLKLSLGLNQSFKGAGASLFRAAFLSRDPGELAADRSG